MRKALLKLFLFINYLFVAALLLSHAASEIMPANSGSWLLAFFGIAYPIILVANLGFIVFWLLKQKWAFLLSFIFVSLNIAYVHNYFPLRLGPKNTDTTGLKIMSYNVRMFDVYDWTGHKNTGQHALDYILQQKPDILFIQEYYDKYQKLNSKSKQLNAAMKYAKYSMFHNKWSKTNKGLALFSKYPITYTKVYSHQKGQIFAQVCDIAREKDTLRLINLHLESLRFQKEQYNLLDSLPYKYDHKARSGIWKIGSKLKNAFKHRAQQADSVAQLIAESPYRVIVAGDFNDTPSSYTYFTIKRQLKSTFVESGCGLGATYSRIHFPFRIDNIMCDTSFSVSNFKTHDVGFSDHKPITCVLK